MWVIFTIFIIFIIFIIKQWEKKKKEGGGGSKLLKEPNKLKNNYFLHKGEFFSHHWTLAYQEIFSSTLISKASFGSFLGLTLWGVTFY